ncbi:MAG: flagellar hook-associated protein FlgL [Acidobacteriia bacterium]|nr:flagellar hook-associated protein FlgL [Terriglobia bacterium]
MRVNPNTMPDLLAALNQSQLQTQQAELEISSGRSVNVPSDNPTAAALLVENNDQATFNAGYLQSVSAVEGQLSTADSTLASVVTALQRATTLGIEGANGTLSDGDRAAIAEELQGIQSQLVSLANTSYEGRYVFAGTNTNTAPYVVDGNSPSGVSYVGNGGVNDVSIGSGYKIAVNQPGSQLFSAAGGDVFLAINNLIQSLQSNSGIDTAVTAVGAASSYLSAQRVFYGNAMNQAQSQTNYLSAAKQQIAQQQNTLGAADLAIAASTLTQTQIDTQATLAVISKLSQNNLFDYIK